jgi:AcrR family transcriptional regulator
MNSNSSREQGLRLRERFRQETAAAVLAAAEEVFAEKGLHEASMAEIAKRAGLAVGTLYNHFADRDSLLMALVEMRKRELIEAIDEQLKALGKSSFVDQLLALVSAVFASCEEHRGLFTAALEAKVGNHSEMAKELYARVDKIVRRGVKDGVLRETGSELYASLLMGMLRGAMMREIYGAPTGPLAECAGGIVELFLYGAKAK